MLGIFRRSSLKKEEIKKDEPPQKITFYFQSLDAIGFRLEPRDTRVVVAEIGPSSEAADKGLKRGDVVVEINGKDTTTWTLDQCVSVCASARPLKLVVLRTSSPATESIPVASLPVAVAKPAIETFETGKPPGPLAVDIGSPGFPTIGCKFDCLHKVPLNDEIRGAPAIPPSRVPPEPKTGWRWRPCVIQALEDPISSKSGKGASGKARVKFLDILPGYPQEDVVDLGEANQFIAPFGLKSPGHIMHHNYRSDDILDVLDIFPSKFDGSKREKWRKCQVVAVSPYFIRVTFSGWSEAYDIWIHVLEEAFRFAEFGQHTERQQVEETNREKDFRKKMLAKGMQVVDVNPDGNCLFRSISVLLFGDESHHAEIRQACCDYMEMNSKRFEFLAEDGDFAGYLKSMRTLGCWGDEPELRVIEELYDRPISMYSCDIVGQDESVDFTEPMAHYRVGEEVAGLQDTEPLRLSFHGNNHYNAVVKVNAPKVYDAHPERNKGRIRTHRLMQGGGSSMTTLRTHHSSFSLRRSNSTVSNIGK